MSDILFRAAVLSWGPYAIARWRQYRTHRLVPADVLVSGDAFVHTLESWLENLRHA